MLRYAFSMSHANISKSFKDSSISAILMLHLYKTLQYVMYDGWAVVWLSATKFPSILMANIILASMCLFPGLIFISSSRQVKHHQASLMQYVHFPYLFQLPWSKIQSPIFCQSHMLIFLYRGIVSLTYVSYARNWILSLK